jgi:ribosomal 50S subunit-associated protein YjgA (DUF615 family)
VTYVFTAIESLTNHSIDQLDDTATIEVEFRKGVVTTSLKAETVRRLNLDEKLSRAVPLCTTAKTSRARRRGSATFISSHV